MPYKIRPGVELIQVCGQDILVSKREIWKECTRIKPIVPLWGLCCRLMLKNKSDQDVINIFSDVFHRSEEDLKTLKSIFATLAKEGFLIEVPDEDEPNDED